MCVDRIVMIKNTTELRRFPIVIVYYQYIQIHIV
jgi:hypothetical protein